MKRDLDRSDYEAAAADLRCEVAAIEAVALVESGPYGAFYSAEKHGEELDGWPVILYEPHVFSRNTTPKGRWDDEVPHLSRPGWSRSYKYGKPSEQPSKLLVAMEIDEPAAIMACSWGNFQVLAENWKGLGYSSVHHFEAAMRRGVEWHLEAFLRFVKWKKLEEALRVKDWRTFARRYNGSGQIDHYAGLMADAYQRLRRV